jgi:hypothetical protein
VDEPGILRSGRKVRTSIWLNGPHSFGFLVPRCNRSYPRPVSRVMTTLSKTFLLPNMIWQSDAMEVEDAARSCPCTERVEFDLEHHLATVEYNSPKALEDILMYLALAGYPAANA